MQYGVAANGSTRPGPKTSNWGTALRNPDEKFSSKRSSSFLPGVAYVSIAIPGVSLERKVAEGATSDVYRGTDDMSGCAVAVKVLSVKNRDKSDEIKRLVREGELAAKIKYHDCIAQTFRHGKVDKIPYIVQEWVEGNLLREVIRKRKVLQDKEIVMLAAAIGRALRHIHENGILHKDVKPDNIFCCPDGGFKLIDFGNAEPIIGWKLPFLRKLEGSPAYMAPEYILTKRAGIQSDIYSLCCTLYECATGRPPYVGGNIDDILKQHIDPHKSAESPRNINKKISVYTNRMIALGLSKDPAKRYKTAHELLMEIARNPLYEVNLSDRGGKAAPTPGDGG